mgnify:CR=1 FL=1
MAAGPASRPSSFEPRLAASVAAIGLHVMHVPASRPNDFATLEDMVAAAVGCDRIRVGGTHMHDTNTVDLATMISHERALRMIYLSNYTWGAIFEDDAELHPDIKPSQTAHILQQASVTVSIDESHDSRARSIGLLLGGNGPRCGGNTSQTHFGGLHIGLLRGTRCSAWWSHAYAVTREHARTFYQDVVCAIDEASGQPCGHRCHARTCTLDWHWMWFFKYPAPERRNLPPSSPWHRTEMWFVGGGLASNASLKLAGVGLFVQNRSTKPGNFNKPGARLVHVRWPPKPIEHVSLCSANGGLPQGGVMNLSAVDDGPRSAHVSTIYKALAQGLGIGFLGTRTSLECPLSRANWDCSNSNGWLRVKSRVTITQYNTIKTRRLRLPLRASSFVLHPSSRLRSITIRYHRHSNGYFIAWRGPAMRMIGHGVTPEVSDHCVSVPSVSKPLPGTPGPPLPAPARKTNHEIPPLVPARPPSKHRATRHGHGLIICAPP